MPEPEFACFASEDEVKYARISSADVTVTPPFSSAAALLVRRDFDRECCRADEIAVVVGGAQPPRLSKHDDVEALARSATAGAALGPPGLPDVARVVWPGQKLAEILTHMIFSRSRSAILSVQPCGVSGTELY